MPGTTFGSGEIGISFNGPIETRNSPPGPPEKKNIQGPGLPTVQTQGPPRDQTQVGVLVGDKTGEKGSPLLLPLQGRPMNGRTDRWEYQALGSDDTHQVSLPISRGGKKCQGGPGCDEVQNGDTIALDGQSAGFNATIYDNEGPRQNPDIV